MGYEDYMSPYDWTGHVVEDEKHIDPVKQKPIEGVRHVSRKHEKAAKRIELSLTKPSYTLTLGPENVRKQNRDRLHYLLLKLVRGRNWKEASDVLSILMRRTCRETSLLNNRLKYWAAMELFKHKDGDHLFSKSISGIFDSWRNNYGRIEKKDPYVDLEFIIYCLTHGNLKQAEMDASIQKDDEKHRKDPLSNLVFGLTFFEVWYSMLPEELKLSSFDIYCMPKEPESSSAELHEPVKNPEEDDAMSVIDLYSQSDCDSETSVRNDKHFSRDFDGSSNQEAMKVETNHKGQMMAKQSQVWSLDSDEIKEKEEGYNPHVNATSYEVFCTQGLKPSLLPIIRLDPDLVEEFLSFCENHFYKDALHCLNVAIRSTPPVAEAALVPLMQLYLLGGKLDKALYSLNLYCRSADTALPFRIKAHLLECFHRGTNAELITCYEAIMKIDPTCGHSVKRLLELTAIGEYGSDQLLEMLADHLDVTHANADIWREFALCLLKVSSEQDRMSASVNGVDTEHGQGKNVIVSRIPARFTEGILGKNWKLRFRWWLRRHFSKDILTSELKAGDFQLMTSKAACASHFYGPEFGYVVEVCVAVRDKGDESMLQFLQMHVSNSIRLCPNIFQRCR